MPHYRHNVFSLALWPWVVQGIPISHHHLSFHPLPSTEAANRTALPEEDEEPSASAPTPDGASAAAAPPLAGVRRRERVGPPGRIQQLKRHSYHASVSGIVCCCHVMLVPSGRIVFSLLIVKFSNSKRKRPSSILGMSETGLEKKLVENLRISLPCVYSQEDSLPQYKSINNYSSIIVLVCYAHHQFHQCMCVKLMMHPRLNRLGLMLCWSFSCATSLSAYHGAILVIPLISIDFIYMYIRSLCSYLLNVCHSASAMEPGPSRPSNVDRIELRLVIGMEIK